MLDDIRNIYFIFFTIKQPIFLQKKTQTKYIYQTNYAKIFLYDNFYRSIKKS